MQVCQTVGVATGWKIAGLWAERLHGGYTCSRYTTVMVCACVPYGQQGSSCAGEERDHGVISEQAGASASLNVRDAT